MYILLVIYLISIQSSNSYLAIPNMQSSTSGLDERLTNYYDKTTIAQLYEFHQKKKLLDCLESKQVNLLSKISIANKINKVDIIQPINLLAGGLFDDWTF